MITLHNYRPRPRCVMKLELGNGFSLAMIITDYFLFFVFQTSLHGWIWKVRGRFTKAIWGKSALSHSSINQWLWIKALFQILQHCSCMSWPCLRNICPWFSTSSFWLENVTTWHNGKNLSWAPVENGQTASFVHFLCALIQRWRHSIV